jgi:hypothetical protein
MKMKSILFGLLVTFLGIVVVIGSSTEIKKKSSYSPRVCDIENSVKGIKGAVDYLVKIRNNQQSGIVNAADELNARESVKKLRNSNHSSRSLSWTELGPDNIGGRTRAFLIDETDPTYQTFYAGSVSGGLWKSTSSGTSWTRIAGFDDNLAVSCITQAPSGDIYVGTGEGLYDGIGNGGRGFIGNGAYRVEPDNNDNVTHLTALAPVPNEHSEYAYINAITADPVSGRLYVATNRGLRVSDDNGDSWYNPIKLTGNVYNTSNAYDVDVSPDGGFVIASVGNWAWVSQTGDSLTFENKSGGSSGLPNSGLGRIEFAIAPSDPSIIYASAAKTSGALDNVYKSEDSGETWMIIGPGGSSEFNIFWYGGDITQGQGVYDNAIAVFPNNPDKIFVGGINMWKGEKVGSGFYSWEQISNGQLDNINPKYCHVDHHTYVFHPTKPNTCYIGSDGGVAVTQDGGETFITLNNDYSVTQFYSVAYSNSDPVIGGTQDNGTLSLSRKGWEPKNGKEINGGDGGHCAISLINPKVFFLSNQRGSVYRSPDSLSSISTSAAFLGTVDGLNAAFVTPFAYWESFNSFLSRDSVTFTTDKQYNPGDSILLRSNNNLYPFYHIAQKTYLKNREYTFQDIIQSKFFYGVQGAVYMTFDALDFSATPKWYKIADISGTTQTLAYSKDGNHLYVGTQGGNLYRISNIAYSYDSISADIRSAFSVISYELINTFSGQAVTSISVDANYPEKIIVTLGNYGNDTYIYYSDNALDQNVTFTSKQANLPKMPVYASLIEMNNPEKVIIGTEYGVFYTDDISSPDWEASTDFPTLPTFMIKQQIIQKSPIIVPIITGTDTAYFGYQGTYNWGEIYAATHGRGLYQCSSFVGIDDIISGPDMQQVRLNVYPNPAVDNVQIEFDIKQNEEVSILVFDLQGRVVKSISPQQYTVGSHKVSVNCNELTNGTYIVHMIAGQRKSSSKLVVMK